VTGDRACVCVCVCACVCVRRCARAFVVACPGWDESHRPISLVDTVATLVERVVGVGRLGSVRGPHSPAVAHEGLLLRYAMGRGGQNQECSFPIWAGSGSMARMHSIPLTSACDGAVRGSLASRMSGRFTMCADGEVPGGHVTSRLNVAMFTAGAAMLSGGRVVRERELVCPGGWGRWEVGFATLLSLHSVRVILLFRRDQTGWQGMRTYFVALEVEEERSILPPEAYFSHPRFGPRARASRPPPRRRRGGGGPAATALAPGAPGYGSVHPACSWPNVDAMHVL
jgi:hypothetical protein